MKEEKSRTSAVASLLGDVDCMDSNDEKSGSSGKDCFFRVNSFGCDERLCIKPLWSCGDGQCITPWNRFGYQQTLSVNEYCQSHREINHMCEANTRWR